MTTLHLATKGIRDVLFVWSAQKINHLDSHKKVPFRLSNRPTLDDICLAPLRFALENFDRSTPIVLYANFPISGFDLNEFGDFENIRFGYKGEYENPAVPMVNKYAEEASRYIFR